MKKRTIYIGLFLIFIIGLISLIGTFAIDSTITEGNSSKADYLFNIVLGDRTNRDILIPSYDSKIVDIKISNPNEFNMSYLFYLEGLNSGISAINISDTNTSGILDSKNTSLIKVFIQNNSNTDITVSIKDLVGFEKETLSLPSNGTAINKGSYYKSIVKSNNNTYGKVKPNIKLSTSNGTVKYTLVPNTGYQYKSDTCNGTVSNNILTISNITSNISCEVVFEPIKVQVNLDLDGGGVETTYTEPQEYTYTVPYTGTYKLEAWGAQGHGVGGAPGGYTSGKVELVAGATLNVYVGGMPTAKDGGYNGGGAGYSDTAGGGGGATDYRYNGTSLNDRIMVAGGGGGNTTKNKGYAGGLIGTTAYASNYSSYTAGGGTQTAGGVVKNYSSSYTVGTDGSFGQGGTGGGASNGGSFGGGGGYYGGAGGSRLNSGNWPGGGGSSYISGHTGCVAVESSSSTTPRTGTDGASCATETSDNLCSVHYSGVSFYDTVMIGGDGYAWTNTKGDLQYMPNPTGGSYASGVGQKGDGTAKITLMSNYSYDTVYNTKYTLPTPVKDGYAFVGWYTKPNGEGTKVDENTSIISTSTHTLYAYWMPISEYDSAGSYTYVIPRSGMYKLEVWGAQGGDAKYSSTTYVGGYGGYSVGSAYFKAGTTLYLNVGGEGQDIFNDTNSTAAATVGYNGGSYGTAFSGNSNHGGGGGATHIATISGLLKELSENIDSILIVAGGGGGAAAHRSSPSYSGNGGSGGGYNGVNGITGNTTCYAYGLGGTQTAGGTHTKCSSQGKAPGTPRPTDAGFGYGSGISSFITSTAERQYTTGGGGYYGGGFGYHAPAGGGSGYIGNSLLTNKYMYCYNCDTSDEVDTKTYTTTNTSEIANSDYAKMGDGAIKITFLEEDTEAPTGTISASKDYNTINVSIDATDNFGIDHYEYYLSTSSTCPTSGYTTSSSNTHSFFITETGTYYVCARVMDKSDNVLLLRSNAINYSKIYFAKVRYNVNGGTISSNAGGYTWTTDSAGLIYRNGNVHEQIIYYGKPEDLNDYNNSDYININTGELRVPVNSEWICLSGCSTTDKLYSQTTKYDANDFCDELNNECTVVLGLNLITDTTKPTCTLSADASTITATASDDVGIAYQGWDSSYSGDNSTSKSIATGTYTYYVKDTSDNTNSCSITIAATQSRCSSGYTLTSAGDKCYTTYGATPIYQANGNCYCGTTSVSTGCVMSGTTAVCGTCSNGASPSQNNCYASISSYTCISGGTRDGSTCYIYTSVSKVCSSGYTKINDSYCYK